MTNLFCNSNRRTWPHLRDDLLIRMFDEDSPSLRLLRARRHLRKCRRCNDRQRELEHVLCTVVGDLEGLIAELQPSSPVQRGRFIRNLDDLLGSLAARPRRKRFLDRLRVRRSASLGPSFAGVAFALCVGLILLSYWHWRLPTVSANELLARAVASESNRTRVSDGGVVRQRVRIKTARKTLDRVIYRDVSGPLHPRTAGAATEEAALADHLVLAGVDWDDPLSAASFKKWHDRQVHLVDEVRSNGKGLITILTRPADTPVVEESLTVTDDSFLSVEKSIEYRDIGNVRITDGGREPVTSETAEQLFPKYPPSEVAERNDFPVRFLPPNRAQLDETELKARLALSQQRADTGEQIEIARNARGVLVTGIVDSENREQELRESLRGIPFLKIIMKNFDEYKSTTLPAIDRELPEESAVANISPLERYFLDQGRTRDDLSQVSARLFDSSLAINRTSRAIDELVLRFCDDKALTPVAIQSRDALLERNASRLLDALSEQERAQKEGGITFEGTPISHGPLDTKASQLAALAERNMIAVKELVSGDSQSSNATVQSITAELGRTNDSLRNGALGIGPGCRVPDKREQP